MGEPLFDLEPPRPRVRVRFDAEDPVLAAAAWSRLAEPGDAVAGALVAHLGAAGALAWLLEAADDPARALRGEELVRLAAAVQECTLQRLVDAVGRWSQRLASLDPRRELRVLDQYDGALLTPADPRWPRRLDDLGVAAPFALWVRGSTDVAGWSRRSVAVVGARAATSYGERVAEDLAAGLVDRGFTVVSGGAYGIDAAAHRGAVASGGVTCAVLAGGVDRFYPQGNDALLRRVVGSGGAVLSEVPPGSAPFRQRFLSRNRVIAALTGATVVVEAARRSGALSTARRAIEISRPVGAVPGPVTSMASTGCHGLLRDGAAVCVSDADEAAELAGDLGADAAPAHPDDAGPRSDPRAGLGPDELLVLDALPVRSGATVDALARTAGLPPRRVVSVLGALDRRGLTRRDGPRWRGTGGRR
ncbi:DNA-processing protein DprA [Isoptericola sp. S6320L]|uniref:DNA-processing protein DprA n=1 Tax=Isoptericola sp. S6320L TaxID=2926411 RepID=UPI001FF1E6E2|nr:DNA-processing protein DprA [Isoptericola sp. S6320L]MCK0117068.1 DNA-processing protein DprA [Isoptericola sp. S6320L]